MLIQCLTENPETDPHNWFVRKVQKLEQLENLVGGGKETHSKCHTLYKDNLK